MWNKKYNKCIKCGTTEISHKARGLCRRCYIQDPKVKKRRNEQAKGYYRRDAESDEYRRMRNERTKKYYHEVLKLDRIKLARRKYRNRGYDEKKRMIDFLEGKGTEKKGITIVCYGCSKECKVVSPIIDIRNEQEKMKRFREVLINNCKKK